MLKYNKYKNMKSNFDSNKKEDKNNNKSNILNSKQIKTFWQRNSKIQNALKTMLEEAKKEKQ